MSHIFVLTAKHPQHFFHIRETNLYLLIILMVMFGISTLYVVRLKNTTLFPSTVASYET